PAALRRRVRFFAQVWMVRPFHGVPYSRSSPHPFEQALPYPPWQHDHRIGMVTAQHQQVVLAEPVFERGEAGAVLALLHLGDEWRLLIAEDVDIDVVARAPESAGA